MSPICPFATLVSCYALAVLSAVVPWVNAEIIMVSFGALADSSRARWLLVLAATLGQMSGKSLMYGLARAGALTPGPRMAGQVERWKAKLGGRPSAVAGVMFLSATLGVPPFYLVALLAGVLRVRFARFAVAGLSGRFCHFAALAFLPWVVQG